MPRKRAGMGDVEGMATDKGEDAPARPPIPGDLPYREPPVIEGKAEEVHETRLDPAESGSEASATEPSGGSMDELKAAMESALEGGPSQTAPEPSAPDPVVREPDRSWPVWPLGLAALIGL